LLWGVHNGIERIIRIAVPAILIGVPLLLYVDDHRPPKKAPAPLVSATPDSWNLEMCRVYFEQHDYSKCLSYAKLYLANSTGTDRQTQCYMAMVSSVEVGQAAGAREWFHLAGENPTLLARYQRYAKTKFRDDLLPKVEAAAQENRMDKAIVLFAQAQELALQCKLYNERLARARASLSLLAIDYKTPRKSLVFIVPSRYGDLWEEDEWTCRFDNAAECASALEKLKSCADLESLQAWTKAQEQVHNAYGHPVGDQGPLVAHDGKKK
jgi:hypothetical protein